MHVIYDVSHNIAKVEEHVIDGKQHTLLVHRKGSTRAFPPHHPLIPVDYQVTRFLHFIVAMFCNISRFINILILIESI